MSSVGAQALPVIPQRTEKRTLASCKSHVGTSDTARLSPRLDIHTHKHTDTRAYTPFSTQSKHTTPRGRPQTHLETYSRLATEHDRVRPTAKGLRVCKSNLLPA